MKTLFDANGFVVWEEDDLLKREHCSRTLALNIKQALLKENGAWRFIQIESSVIIPQDELIANYGSEDVFMLDKDSSVLRPETTQGSYKFAADLLSSHSKIRAPLCVWQIGKSFRREQNATVRRMKLKEFTQQEFQCVYSADSKNDYYHKMLPVVLDTLSGLVKGETRLIESDRLPDYSEETWDVEVFSVDKWMELCSISLRKDFTLLNNSTQTSKTFKVLEIAVGLDRCVYNMSI